MDKVYIFGHRNPDTDSVTSAITLSYLKRKLGMNAIPVILSSINKETKYALNYFKVREPIFLNDVKMKVKDLDYLKDFMATSDTSIYEVYNKMHNKQISKIPITNKTKKIIGIISMTDIAENCLDNNILKIETNYNNILNTIKGRNVLKYDNLIKGNIIIPGYTNDYNEAKNNIIILDKREEIQNYLNNNKTKLIILTNNIELTQEELIKAKNNKINIIKTTNNYLNTIMKINFSNFVSTITKDYPVSIVNENNDLSSFITSAEKTKFTYYPIIDNNEKCLGIIKFGKVSYNHKKKVILVDHNSYSQSAIGIEEAEILEIIDHHNLSNNGTNYPINFRNMPLGSTCTIIYLMYKENNIKIPKNMAGLMLSGILSDTLILNSPTTTKTDKDAVNNLARIACVDYKKYGFDMISYGTDLKGKTKEEILYNDFKKYPTSLGTIGLGQIYTTNIEGIEKEKDEYVDMLNSVAKINEYKFLALFVTDIIKNGTYIYYSEEGKDILSEAFNVDIYEGYYLDGILSRKLQILPNILNIMD